MKNGEPTVDLLIFMTIFQHTISFGQKFLSKEQCDSNGPSPILSWPGCSWFLPVFLTEIGIKVWHFCDATDIIKNATEELKISANYMCMIAVHRTSNVVTQTHLINWYVSRLISCTFAYVTHECY